MFKEIGSNFFLDAATISSYPLKEETQIFKHYARDIIYSSSGRGAISLALDQLKSNNKVALLPIYTCGSVIRPFLKKGYTVQYYDIEPDLTISWDKLKQSILLHRPDVLLFHAYFGFDTHRTIQEHIAFLRQHSITIIEDLTHSLFSDFEKADADFHVASIQKWLPIPDGGLIFSKRNIIDAPTGPSQEAIVEIHLKAFQEKYRYTQTLNGNLKQRYRELFSQAEEVLALDSSFYPISDPALRIIQNSDYHRLKQSRKENYCFLLKEMQEFEFARPVFPELPEGVIPLFFPVFVEMERTELREFMASNEVYLPIHWPISKHVINQLTPNAKYIYNHILAIPIDQRYTVQDLRRLVDLLKSYQHALKTV